MRQSGRIDGNQTEIVKQLRDMGATVHPMAAVGGGFPDLAVGFRNSTSGYSGGIRLFFLDGGVIPANGTDPSGGGASSMFPALNSNYFNTGDNPMPVGTDLMDLAGAMKSSSTAGALLIFMR